MGDYILASSPDNLINKQMQQGDPLAVIQTDTPQFSDAAAIDIVRRNYGFDASVKTLVSERDQNFHLNLSDGRQFVLKIANAVEDPEVTMFQIDALLHLEERQKRYPIAIKAPRVMRTLRGAASIRVTSASGHHIARVVSYVPGTPLGDRVPSPSLCANMGTYLAHLGRALNGFSHPGNSQKLLWDLQQASSIRELLTCIADPALRCLVQDTLLEFERGAAPELPHLRSQVIHSDFNPDNVLVDANDDNHVAGVIDFGDMLHAPLIVDVAIGACYLRPRSGNPLALMAEFVSGYHRVTSLSLAELEVLFILIKTRLAVSVAILYWRAAARDDDDPYLVKIQNSESLAENFLAILNEIPRASATTLFRQICASADLAGQ